MVVTIESKVTIYGKFYATGLLCTRIPLCESNKFKAVSIKIIFLQVQKISTCENKGLTC